MNILITGGAGYIGSTLVKHYLDRGNKVTVVDNLLYKQVSLSQYCYNKRFNFIKLDVRDSNELKKLVAAHDVIIPLAAIVGFPACERDKQLATDVNTGHIQTICKDLASGQRLIYPNTNSGYGVGGEDQECTEETPLNPITHYGETKCAAERCVLGHGGISLRLATVFGVSPRFRIDLLVNDFVYRAYKDGFIVLFEKDFKRNFIHVVDVCAAFLKMTSSYDKYKGEAFNVGLSSANLSKMQLCDKIKEYYPNFSVMADEIHTDPDKRDYIVSNKKLEDTGWQPQNSLDDGIQELTKFYPIVSSATSKFTNL